MARVDVPAATTGACHDPTSITTMPEAAPVTVPMLWRMPLANTPGEAIASVRLDRFGCFPGEPQAALPQLQPSAPGTCTVRMCQPSVM
jgi:hypothetical protein